MQSKPHQAKLMCIQWRFAYENRVEHELNAEKGGKINSALNTVKTNSIVRFLHFFRVVYK